MLTDQSSGTAKCTDVCGAGTAGGRANSTAMCVVGVACWYAAVVCSACLACGTAQGKYRVRSSVLSGGRENPVAAAACLA